MFTSLQRGRDHGKFLREGRYETLSEGNEHVEV